VVNFEPTWSNNGRRTICEVISRFDRLPPFHRTLHRDLRVHAQLPSDELYGLRSQLRRASVSIPSNIAEGCGRRSTGELIQFAAIARGSNFEVQTQLMIANKLHYGSNPGLMECNRLSEEAGRMLNAWVNFLKERQSKLLTTNH
jgi:four helix bundle protein